MLKKIFISQAMHGISDEIVGRKALAILQAFMEMEHPEDLITPTVKWHADGRWSMRYKTTSLTSGASDPVVDDEYLLIANMCHPEPPEGVNERVWMLGESVSLLGCATDVIFADEDTGAQAKGCKVERAVCAYYGIRAWQYHDSDNSFTPIITPIE